MGWMKTTRLEEIFIGGHWTSSQKYTDDRFIITIIVQNITVFVQYLNQWFKNSVAMRSKIYPITCEIIITFRKHTINQFYAFW